MEGQIQEQQAMLVEVTKFINSWLTWYTLFKKLVRLLMFNSLWERAFLLR